VYVKPFYENKIRREKAGHKYEVADTEPPNRKSLGQMQAYGNPRHYYLVV
jgi:hypothetical protein